MSLGASTKLLNSNREFQVGDAEAVAAFRHQLQYILQCPGLQARGDHRPDEVPHCQERLFRATLGQRQVGYQESTRMGCRNQIGARK